VFEANFGRGKSWAKIPEFLDEFLPEFMDNLLTILTISGQPNF
jgi:hypothetical protein